MKPFLKEQNANSFLPLQTVDLTQRSMSNLRCALRVTAGHSCWPAHEANVVEEGGRWRNDGAAVGRPSDEGNGRQEFGDDEPEELSNRLFPSEQFAVAMAMARAALIDSAEVSESMD